MLVFSMLYMAIQSVVSTVAFNRKCLKIEGSAFKRAKHCCIKLLIILLYFFELSIVIPLALATSVLLAALAIGPAYLYQFYLLISICWESYFKSYTDDPVESNSLAKQEIDTKEQPKVVQIDME